ncbi:NAD(P)-binding domain-containing protein [Bacillus sp. B190/17]|uniref:NAD(P)-binding domain-containing protein n=1 Tax=Bacillus lumedeiriae TaxID=3058829 RepID=A0ABW8IAA0_9BACI
MKVGLAGIGKLGTAMMKHWSQNGRVIGVYHPTKAKAKRFIQQYQYGYVLSEKELLHLDVLILALPAKEIIPFIDHLLVERNPLSNTCIINMATTLYTKDIKSQFPDLRVLGVKFMGHGRDLLERRNGLFITESSLPSDVQELFQELGKIKVDNEEQVVRVNKLATYYAVKTALEIEKKFTKEALDIEYVQRALTSLAPEVIRSYSKGSLGHFGREIAKELETERSSK